MDTDNVAADTSTADAPAVTASDPPAPQHEETGPADALGPTVDIGDGQTWSPPKQEPETGIAVDGEGLPINHRLRAERLAESDAEEDPLGEVSPELIADAKDRLARQDKATPPVNANMKVAELERIAKREKIDISSAANNAERVALIEAARVTPGLARIEENA
jgi:hypothetical protein